MTAACLAFALTVAATLAGGSQLYRSARESAALQGEIGAKRSAAAFLLTLAGRLTDEDGASAADISPEQLRSVTAEIAGQTSESYCFVLDKDGVVVAHSEDGELGRNYLRESGTLGAAVARALRGGGESLLKLSFDGQDYMVYAERPQGGWCCASAVNMAEYERPPAIILAALALLTLLEAAVFLLTLLHLKTQRLAVSLKALSETDPLTGVRSKHAWLIKEKELDAAVRSGGADAFAVVVCDVNGLKKINDTYGHKAGDAYIREACGMVCDIFRHSPVYRVGGDEFAVVLTGRDYALRGDLMSALHERSVEHIAVGGAVVAGGLASLRPGEDGSARDLFQRADERMYEEKKRLKSLGAAARDDEASSAECAEGDEEPPIIRVKRHLLIVEDERINRELLGLALRGGYELLYAADGCEALEQVRAHREHLAMILLDLQMPRLSGIEVLKILKNDEELRSIPVIVMTADQEAELDCLNLGAMDFIPKPYPKREIIRARVSKCIELSETRDIIRATERDSLTSLFNLDYFFRYVRLYDQNYPELPMDAAALDIDRFRTINERCGRKYGDRLLRRLGERVRTLARKLGGVGSRQGADTFLIYLPHQEDYAALLARLSADLCEEGDGAAAVRLRMGVYTDADKALDIRLRFERAKRAADAVKRTGGEAVGFWSGGEHA